MKTTEIVGFKREDLGTSSSKKLRADGNVPCVVYGSGEPIHFHTPMYLFRDLIYTPEAKIVNLNVEGQEMQCILKEAQFHPVSEMILHADFFLISEDKAVVIEVPVKVTGTSPGVANGGKLFMKVNKLKVKAVPSKLPDFVEVSIEGLELGKSVRVRDTNPEGYEILNNEQVTIASVIIPRALKTADDLDEGEEGAEGEEATEEAAAE